MQGRVEGDFSSIMSGDYTPVTVPDNQGGFFSFITRNTIGDLTKVISDPAKFITGELYDRSVESGTGVGVGYLGPQWYSGTPQFVVVSSDDMVKAIVSYDSTAGKDDPRAREPFDITSAAEGVRSLINFRGAEAMQERKKFKAHLTGPVSIDETYKTVIRPYFQEFLANWNIEESYQNNITHFCTNIISRCVYGIPDVPMKYMPLLREMNHEIARFKPKSPEFKSAAKKLKLMNDELIEANFDTIMNSSKHIREQLELKGDESREEILEKLKETNDMTGITIEDNISAAVMTGIAMISQSSDIKARLREELATVDMGSLKNLFDLPYLDCVFREVLRYLTPVAIFARQTGQPFTLESKDSEGKKVSYNIPGGSFLFAPMRRIHHDSRYWKNPESFDPDRFTGLPKINTEHFFPFAYGQRMCPTVATQFTEAVLKTVFAEFFLKHDLVLDKPLEDIPVGSLHPRWETDFQAKVVDREDTVNLDNRLVQ